MPASSRSPKVRPGWRMATTEADGFLSWSRKSPCLRRETLTRAVRTSEKLRDGAGQLALDGAPQVDLLGELGDPRSPRSKSSKPTPPPRGRPAAASMRRAS